MTSDIYLDPCPEAMITNIEQMQQENNFYEKSLAYYYSFALNDKLPNKLHKKLIEIGYPTKFNAKNYYNLMVLIADDYFKVPIYNDMFYSLMQKVSPLNYDLQQKDEDTTRFCSIVKKLNSDVLQKLANVMAKSSRTIISNVTDQDFLKLLI